MKGGVLLIGSLLWEDEENSLDKNQGKLRADWRQDLDLDKKIHIKVPIRYGRKSTSKRCTYTMLFSNSVSELGTAILIPFKKETESFDDLKKQAFELSKAEGISTTKRPDELKANWGAVGIAFNRTKKNQLDEIRKKWRDEFNDFNNEEYKIGNELPSISKNGELNFKLDIPENIHYVFATPVKPNITEYPLIDKIVEAILESKPRYDTYVKKNFEHGIRVQDDEEILKRIKGSTIC